jgi:hypothetical protein
VLFLELRMLRLLWKTFVLLTMTACLASAQQAAVSSPAVHQALNDAWWTGPLLAPSANTLPQGHMLIEPYLYDVISQGFYDSTGKRQPTPHANGFGSLTYINYGLANRFTVGLIPVFGFNQVSQGPDSAHMDVGDLTVQAQYRLHLFREGSWIPTTSIGVQQTLPTGEYDNLGERPNDGLGSGAYTTTLCFYTQSFYWMPTGRILRARFNVTQSFSRQVNLQNASVYGTSEGFRGHANPGAGLFVDLAGEYSITRRWVFASDITYRHQYDTTVTGNDISNPGEAIFLNSGPSQAFAFAPAIEYNFNNRVGVIVGSRVFPAGRNTPNSITPVIAINIVH